MVIVGCPGQGSQTEGFLIPWLEQIVEFKMELEKLSEASGLDLVRLGSSASELEIKDTAIAQPLIVASSIAGFRAGLSNTPISGVLGHSVGEFAAAAIAGILSDDEAITLVKIRGEAMARAAKAEKTSMAAILGGESGEIQSKLDELGLSIANYNGSGQLVAAGLSSDILRLIENPPERSRVIELKVAGAFHTHFMDSAVPELSQAAAKMKPKDPEIAIWSNVDGQLVNSGQDFLDSLVRQVSSPVRWDACMESLPTEPFTFVELPPAGALAGMVKRAVSTASPVALRKPIDLEKVPA